METIIVNATSNRSSGMLTILTQFLEAVPANNFTYIVFVDDAILLEVPPNVQLVHLNKRTLFKRFLWDAFGVKKWLKARGIIPAKTISLQNTNFRVNVSCPNYIYYHNAISLSHFKWNVLKKNQRSSWFYKHIYPFFVKLFINSQTEIFVQLHIIKELFAKKIHIDEQKIHVVFPEIIFPKSEKKLSIIIDKQKINFFYPATLFVFKNHKILFEAFYIIDKLMSKKIVLYLTCGKNKDWDFYRYQNIEVVYLETLPYNEIAGLYRSMDALLFPSYIETVGLPLIEAASLGLPVVVSDLPYAREVLTGYEGVSFVNYQDALAWGNEILKLCTSVQKKYQTFHKQGASWNELFEILEK